MDIELYDFVTRALMFKLGGVTTTLSYNSSLCIKYCLSLGKPRPPRNSLSKVTLCNFQLYTQLLEICLSLISGSSSKTDCRKVLRDIVIKHGLVVHQLLIIFAVDIICA